MAKLRGTPQFKHGQRARVGVLLSNLGTPAAPTTSEVRRYLAEFLSDPRVVELPRIVWLPLLHGIILNLRPRRSAHAYQKIWRADGSPLLSLSRSLTGALAKRFNETPQNELVFALGMRYGQPSIATALDELIAAGARRILVAPLYPQYASATTASVGDAVYAYCKRLRWVPELRFIADYHADAGYIAALAASVRHYWSVNGRGNHFVISFHGIPRDYFLAGDPYYCQCRATARLLAQSLQLSEGEWTLCFQSRFGRQKWLEPYTDKSLIALAAGGVATVDVLCPGFAVDCLETLEEIALQNAALFQRAGGRELRYLPALNDSIEHVDALSGIISGHLGGWLDSRDAATRSSEENAAAARARAAGAAQ
jgi:protoporphyrin/coproporphyrin ferrochelatase